MLVYLASRANKENCCWPGQKTICSDTGYRKSTVQRGLGELEELGYIRRVKRNINRQQGPRSDLIYVLGPARPEQETRCTSAAEKPKRQDAEANKGTPKLEGGCPQNGGGHTQNWGLYIKKNYQMKFHRNAHALTSPLRLGIMGKFSSSSTVRNGVLGRPISGQFWASPDRHHTTLTTDDGRLINGWRFNAAAGLRGMMSSRRPQNDQS
ncbi:MAG: helix-turn-helix domain-containing protein [Rhodobiaceae bacterium]|nr:helix-turn-helix domain-containing protein [Rhodobiaceae bacterium]